MKYIGLFLLLCPLASFSKPVNINTADAQMISESLVEIGPDKAQAIVDYRNKHGQFKSVLELTRIKGVGEKTLLKNKDNILLKDTDKK